MKRLLYVSDLEEEPDENERQFEVLKRTSLSGEDIQRFLKYKVRLIKYKELPKFKTIEDLLHPYGELSYYQKFLTITDIGFACERANMISYFDSYRYFSGCQKELINEEFLESSDHEFHFVMHLLDEASYRSTVEFSDRTLYDLVEYIEISSLKNYLILNN